MKRRTVKAADELAQVRIRLRATLAALDEALSVPVPRHAPPLHDRTRSPGEAAAAVSALEREVGAVTQHGNELRHAAAMERQQSTEWERRAMIAIGEVRHDLAKQATLRAAEHQQHAEQFDDELSEYEALERWYREAIEELRRRGPPSAV